MANNSLHPLPPRPERYTHPLGQTLIVISSVGRIQREGGPIEEIRPGDIVSILPGEKHWHGASCHMAMTHLAITEMKDGRNTNRLEPVTDDNWRLTQPGQAAKDRFAA